MATLWPMWGTRHLDQRRQRLDAQAAAHCTIQVFMQPLPACTQAIQPWIEYSGLWNYVTGSHGARVEAGSQLPGAPVAGGGCLREASRPHGPRTAAAAE